MGLALLSTFLLCSCSAGVAGLRAPQASAVLATITELEAQRTSMGADGTVLVRRYGVPVKGQLAVVADVRGRVRVDVSTEAGNVLFAFASDGRVVSLLDLEKRRFYQAPAGPNDLAPLGLTGMSALALSRLFLARQPCPGAVPMKDTELVTTDCLGGTLTSTYTNQHMLKRVRLDAKHGFDAHLLGHTSSGLPRRLEVHSEAGDIVVQLSDVETNPALQDAMFVIERPPGVQ